LVLNFVSVRKSSVRAAPRILLWKECNFVGNRGGAQERSGLAPRGCACAHRIGTGAGRAWQWILLPQTPWSWVNGTPSR
jgi:hypothetical protein